MLTPTIEALIRLRRTAVLIGILGCALICAQCGPSSGPWQITLRQPQISVTVTQGCPASVRGFRDVHNDSVSSQMLMPQTPQGALICRYGPRPFLTGPSEVGPGLYRTTVLGRSSAIHLANVISAINDVLPPTNPHCPAAFGSVTIIAFHYSSKPDVDLWYSDTGCQTLDNGTIGAWETGNASFFNGFIPVIDQLSPPTPGPSSQ